MCLLKSIPKKATSKNSTAVDGYGEERIRVQKECSFSSGEISTGLSGARD